MLGDGPGREQTSIEFPATITLEGDDAIAQDLSLEEAFKAIDEDGDEECRCFTIPSRET
jgi:hypothetical protein